MSNPVFNNSAVFGPRAGTQARAQQPTYGSAPQPGYGQAAYGSAPQAPYGTAPQYGQYAGPGYGTQDGAVLDARTLDDMYAAPSATTADTKRLTYDDVIIKTGGLLALLVISGAASWMLAPRAPGVWMIGAVVGLVLGLVNSFKKNPSPALIALYTVAEGVFLGGISQAYESWYNGVVPTAVVATIATFVATLALFSSGKVRVTGKFVKWLLIAMTGYLIFSLLNVILVWTGVMDGWGMRSGGIGIVVGVIAVGLAAASLIVDFDSIQRGVRAGVPAKFAWSAAFGLMVTLIWLYLEFLRLAAIFMGRD